MRPPELEFLILNCCVYSILPREHPVIHSHFGARLSEPFQTRITGLRTTVFRGGIGKSFDQLGAPWGIGRNSHLQTQHNGTLEEQFCISSHRIVSSTIVPRKPYPMLTIEYSFFNTPETGRSAFHHLSHLPRHF